MLVLYYALRDKRTPGYAKLPALLSLLYLVSPVDFIPDFIPLFGYLDDLVVVPLLLQASVWLLPTQVRADGMAKAAKHARKLRIGVFVVCILLLFLLVSLFFITKHVFNALWRTY